MNGKTLRPVSSVEQVETIIGKPAATILMKQIDRLDEGARSVLEHSPIAGFGFRDEAGTSQTATFIGGYQGFIRVESPERFSFAFPEDEPHPEMESGVSFVFFLPGVGETLRVNGSVAGWERARLIVGVEEAYVHCARCILRSKLWNAVPVGAGQAETRRSAPGGETSGPLGAPEIKDFLRAAPFLVVSTWGGDGSSDTSPRGDEAGFVRVLDERTLAIPDRKGNQRADTFHNLLADNRLSLAAVVPGRTDVLRASGTGYMTTNPSLLSTMALRGLAPHAALVITVETVKIVDNTALRQSDLWNPTARVDKGTVPDLMALGAKHMTLAKPGATAGAPHPALLKPLAAFPGLIRAMVDIGYRMQLVKEGYSRQSGEHGATSSRGSATRRRIIGGLRSTLSALAHRLGAPDTSKAGGLPLHDVEVVEVIQETEQAVTLFVESCAGSLFQYNPGQYFTVATDIDGSTVRRAYSATSPPGSTRLALTIKRMPGGRCSTYLHDRVGVGDHLRILGPSGNFHVEQQTADGHHLVLLAAGSGITPMMSMIRTLLAESADHRILLLYGNRAEGDIIFARELAELCERDPDRFEVRHFLTQPPKTWATARGRLDESTVYGELLAACPSERTHYYICGPEAMMEGVVEALRRLEIPSERIHQERFLSQFHDLGSVDDQPHRMVVRNQYGMVGAVDVGPGHTLLEAGLSAGLPMPYSCTVGNCGECMVKLCSGNVTVGEPNCLPPDAQEQGFILTCVGRPRSPVLIDIDPDVDAST
ncbi:hypothetical protein A5762_02290 [Mycolicibacterium elephantis]|nr:hypothetical protein A5762_02290 [Mycolicibacterium elephantis]